jgi:PAS domain S-box-containing protein
VSDQPAAGQLPVDELRLEPLAASVRKARRFLRELLVNAGRAQWSDAAELALSEVVTNGVLHAHTELVVRVTVLADGVRVEVRDSNPALPTQRRGHDVEATTGRGLELVSALTRDCGVRPEQTGKVVWFVVGDEQLEEQSEDDLLAAWDLEGAWDAVDLPAPAGDDVHAVVLQALPTTLWLAAREHHQALLRELVLYLAEHGDALPTRPNLVLADEARNLIWAAVVDEIDRAREAGTTRRLLPDGHPSPLPDVPAAVDLVLHVPADLAAAFGALQDALDTGERLAVADLLLVRPGLPEIIAVRDWACEQVVAQLAGVPAAPWPGTDQSRFTEEVHDRAVPDGPSWDDAVVTGSDRGVVAADDANRIIAISAPLARTVGWAPEEIVGRRVVALIPPELREAHVAGFSRHLTTGQAHVLGVPLELPVLRRDGTRVTCSFMIEQVGRPGGRPVYLAWIEPAGS